MAGLNCRVGRKVDAAKYKALIVAVKIAEEVVNDSRHLTGVKTCLGKMHCNLDATSFGDECKTCKTIQ
ncbi:hypothetical protein [Leeuwenhoekiella sp. LLG6367-2.1]|uniref:hypothetical protein n=1 Tax=Leeuwenhoekiella sp. LLG6367-2.1 TaxID=3160833 RepID=UPI00386B478E